MAAVKLYGLLGKDEFGGHKRCGVCCQLPRMGRPLRFGSIQRADLSSRALQWQMLSTPTKGETTAIIEGQASSAASYVAASCSKIRMYGRATWFYMGHGREGRTMPHRQIADDLDRMAGLMRALYRRRRDFRRANRRVVCWRGSC